MEPKTIFKSKTALLGALLAIAGCLGTACDPAADWLKEHAVPITGIAGIASIALRFFTKGKVSMFPKADEPQVPRL
jgi:hypothetical protein